MSRCSLFDWDLTAAMPSRLTCNTVTGHLRPSWSHSAVIPRFRAIAPVRWVYGVHCPKTTPGLGTEVDCPSCSIGAAVSRAGGLAEEDEASDVVARALMGM